MDQSPAARAPPTDDPPPEHHGGSPTPKRSRSSIPSGHKRSLSGSILAKLPFLRSFEELPLPEVDVDHADQRDDAIPRRTSAMAKAVRQSTIGRRRKSSLRKTAILGTGRQRSNEGQASGLSHLRDAAALAVSQVNSPISPGDSTSRPFGYTNAANASAASSSDSGWDAPTAGMPSGLQSLGISTTDKVDSEHKIPRQTADLGSPIASPVTSPTNNPYASTTDDDADSLTFSRPSTAPHYFPSTTLGLSRRRSTKLPGTISGSTTRRSSPLSLPPATLDLDEWDYSETEWWGWVVLVVTWIVFVVGMGSCLEVWSWAWDVGETPYAPPELEDDPTLPIVGYYPALMVLTAVMAWVWVVVAWVGMKYFRHAKVVGEDA